MMYRWIVGVAVPLVAVFVTLAVAVWQIHDSRQSADRRAKDELKLAAIDVVLDAPTCQAAVARAEMAVQVLPGIVPANLPARVRKLRAGSLETNAFVNSGAFIANNFGIPPSQAAGLNLDEFFKRVNQRAARLRGKLCRDLAGTH